MSVNQILNSAGAYFVFIIIFSLIMAYSVTSSASIKINDCNQADKTGDSYYSDRCNNPFETPFIGIATFLMIFALMIEHRTKTLIEESKGK